VCDESCAWNSGSMRAEPVKYSAGPCRDGCEPLRVIVIICDSLVEAAEGAYEPDATLAWFTPTHAEASRDNDMTVAVNNVISILLIRYGVPEFLELQLTEQALLRDSF
jgi:hypothetical protein